MKKQHKVYVLVRRSPELYDYLGSIIKDYESVATVTLNGLSSASLVEREILAGKELIVVGIQKIDSADLAKLKVILTSEEAVVSSSRKVYTPDFIIIVEGLSEIDIEDIDARYSVINF